MFLIQAKDIDEAGQTFSVIKSYKPFKYSGKWFVVRKNENSFAFYSSLKTASKNCQDGQVWIIQ